MTSIVSDFDQALSVPKADHSPATKPSSPKYGTIHFLCLRWSALERTVILASPSLCSLDLSIRYTEIFTNLPLFSQSDFVSEVFLCLWLVSHLFFCTLRSLFTVLLPYWEHQGNTFIHYYYVPLKILWHELEKKNPKVSLDIIELPYNKNFEDKRIKHIPFWFLLSRVLNQFS